MMDLISEQENDAVDEADDSANFQQETGQMIKLYDLEPYTAFSEDLEFMWRWTIYRDKKLVQEGCSLTLDASRHAVKHVMAFFNVSADHLVLGA